MDKLLEQYVNDEITEEQFKEEVDKLSPEDRVKLEEQAKKETGDTFSTLKALRKEKNRVEKKIEVSPAKDEVNYGEKFRQEQIAKAKDKFFKDRGITEAEQSAYEEAFKNSGSKNVDSELIYRDFQSIYASRNASRLLEQEDKLKEMEKNAAEYNLAGAGPGATAAGDDDKKYDTAVYQFVERSRKAGTPLTLEQADKYLRQGNSRTF